MYYSMNDTLHNAEKDISNHNNSKKGGRDERGQSVIYSFDIGHVIILPIKSSTIRNKYLYIKLIAYSHELFEMTLKHIPGAINPGYTMS